MSHYIFGQKAQRIVAVEVSHKGTVRPLLIPDTKLGLDSLNLTPIRLKENESVTFTVSVDRPDDPLKRNWGFSAIEYATWRPGAYYRSATLNHVLNTRWPLSRPEAPELPFTGTGEFGSSKPIADVDYTFAYADGSWTLSWGSQTGSSVESCKVNLTEDLQYATVVLRLVDGNRGQIKFKNRGFGSSNQDLFRSEAPAGDAGGAKSAFAAGSLDAEAKTAALAEIYQQYLANWAAVKAAGIPNEHVEPFRQALNQDTSHKAMQVFGGNNPVL